jgi:hypothetical protein
VEEEIKEAEDVACWYIASLGRSPEMELKNKS